MQVHTSNYRVSGFTKAVALPELVALGQQRGLPVIDDIGSGVDLPVRDVGSLQRGVPHHVDDR